MRQFLRIAYIGLATIMLASCGITELIPLQRPGQEDNPGAEAFYNRDGSDLIIRVSNVGPKDAPPTKVSVEFPELPTQSVMTPTIAGQSIVEVKVQIPTGCFNSDCEFTITVDADNIIAEPREDNNTKAGRCIG